jgi:hypothetical protein
MDWLSVLNGAMGAGAISIILRLIDAYSNRNKTRADAAKVIVEGGVQAVKMMKDILADYDRTNDEQADEIDKLKKDVEAAAEGRAERIKRISELEEAQVSRDAVISELERKIKQDMSETQKLRNDYAVAQKQIISLEDLVIRAGDYIDKMKTAMQKAGIELPLNGELLESVLRLKAERAQRGKK